MDRSSPKHCAERNITMTEPARAGIIIPSSNRQVEQEMIRWFPREVQPHIARLRMTGPHARTLPELLPRITEAAATLNDARCGSVIFHCTGNSMQAGPAGEEQIRAALSAGTTATVATTATAVCNALHAVGARRIVLFTPSDASTTSSEADYLRACGFDVVASHGLDLGGSDEFCRAPSSFWYETVVKARQATDAYFLSCANIACFEVVDALERTLERPVVTSNQAVLWEAVRRSGSNAAVERLGSLFSAGSAAAS
jgi:maleate isomerase